MSTTRRRRAQAYREPITPPLAVWFLTGDTGAAFEARETESTGFGGGVVALLYSLNHPALWAAHADDLIAEWSQTHPGHRPWAWWRYDALEGRRQLAGSGRPVVAPYGPSGVDSWRLFHGLPVLLDLDPDDPPVFESQAAYLRRLDLLARDEVSRLDRAAYDPVEMIGRADPPGYTPRGEGLDDDDLDDADAAREDDDAVPG